MTFVVGQDAVDVVGRQAVCCGVGDGFARLQVQQVDAAAVCSEPYLIGGREIHGIDEAVAPGVGIGRRGEVLFEVPRLFIQ